MINFIFATLSPVHEMFQFGNLYKLGHLYKV